VTIIISGVRELRTAMTAMVARQDAATRTGLGKAAHLLEREIKAQLSTGSHQAHEPTTSAPGSAPDLVSGDLRRSVQVDDMLSLGQGRYSTQVGPTIVYGRIQEFGGQTGRNHATTLPPRPYVAPALEKMTPVMFEVMKSAWAAALRG
jgi:phage gpG-like protein